MLETVDKAMHIARVYGISCENQEISSAIYLYDCTKVYYKKMLEANLGNPLLLKNYAKILHEVWISPIKQFFIVIW